MNPNPVWMDPVKPVPQMTQHHRDLMAMGLCPFCERHIRGWRSLCINSGIADVLAALETNGIDYRTGHALDCEYKRIAIESQAPNAEVRGSKPSSERDDDTTSVVAAAALGGLAGAAVGNLFH